MKTAGTVKGSENDSRYEGRLRVLLERVPWLRVGEVRSRRLGRQREDVDFELDVRAGGRRTILVAEAKQVGHPRQIREAVLRLRNYLAHLPRKGHYHGVILAPFISEASAKLCEEAGFSYADLAGNARLAFDHVYIETQSADNPFREKRESRSLFAPRAARVLRFLLHGPLKAWKVTEVASKSGVSLGWVSAVRQQLLAREWATEGPGGLRITRPEAVLDAWAKADDWDKRTTTRQYSLVAALDPELVGKKLLKVCGDHEPVFTQWLAATLRHPYTTTPVVTAYVTGFPDPGLIEDKFLGRLVPSGGQLHLVLPKDAGGIRPRQTVRGFPLVSDVQIYLDLLRAGKRGEEQAAELRRWPDFAGGWE